MTRAELQATGFTRTSLAVAFGRPSPVVTEPLSIDLARLIATILRRFHIEDVQNCELVLDGNQLRFAPRPAPPIPVDASPA
jgi:hypothetical protein